MKLHVARRTNGVVETVFALRLIPPAVGLIRIVHQRQFAVVTVPQKCVAHSAPGAAKLDAAKQNLAKVILRRSYIRCDYWAILENRMGTESNGVTLFWTVISTRLEISFVFVVKNCAPACDRSVCCDSKVPS